VIEFDLPGFAKHIATSMICAWRQAACESERMPAMIFKWRKSTMKSDPVFGLAELRAAIEHVVERGRNAGLRHYVLAQALEDAATAVRVKHAACSPIL
jgi:hypothetical protein